MNLTDSQRQVLDFIGAFTKERGFAPTRADIAKHFNCTKRNVQQHLERLNKKGAIAWEPHQPRTLRVLQ